MCNDFTFFLTSCSVARSLIQTAAKAFIYQFVCDLVRDVKAGANGKFHYTNTAKFQGIQHCFFHGNAAKPSPFIKIPVGFILKIATIYQYCF